MSVISMILVVIVDFLAGMERLLVLTIQDMIPAAFFACLSQPDLRGAGNILAEYHIW